MAASAITAETFQRVGRFELDLDLPHILYAPWQVAVAALSKISALFRDIEKKVPGAGYIVTFIARNGIRTGKIRFEVIGQREKETPLPLSEASCALCRIAAEGTALMPLDRKASALAFFVRYRIVRVMSQPHRPHWFECTPEEQMDLLHAAHEAVRKCVPNDQHPFLEYELRFPCGKEASQSYSHVEGELKIEPTAAIPRRPVRSILKKQAEPDPKSEPSPS